MKPPESVRSSLTDAARVDTVSYAPSSASARARNSWGGVPSAPMMLCMCATEALR